MTTRTMKVSLVAAALGVSARMIGKYVSKGAPHGIDNRGWRVFDADELRAWVHSHGSILPNGHNKLGAFAGGKGKGSGIDRESPLGVDLALKKERLRKEKLTNDTREGKLIDARDARQAWAAELLTVRTALDGMAPKLASRLCAALQLPAEKRGTILDAVQDEVRHCCRGLST